MHNEWTVLGRPTPTVREGWTALFSWGYSGNWAFVRLDCLNNGSDGPIKQDLAKQQHQLASEFKLYKSLVTFNPYLRETFWEKGPGFWNKVPEETSLHLLLGTQDRCLGSERVQFSCRPTGTATGNYQGTELAWFEHLTRHDSLFKNIIQGTLEGGWRRDR